jgi:hypothetical protein
MNNIISFEEHRNRRNLPQFHDLDELMAESERLLEQHTRALERLNRYCLNAITTVKEWKR